MPATPPTLTDAQIPPIPDDAVLCESPTFGRIAFFEPGAPKAAERGVPRQIVVTAADAFAVPNKAPTALRTRVREAIEALDEPTLGPFAREFLSGASFLRSTNAVTMWWPPTVLDVSCLRESSVGTSLDPAVGEAFRAVAAHLAAQIDEPGLVAAARRHFGLPDRADKGWLLVSERYSPPDSMQPYEVSQMCRPFLGVFAQAASFRCDVDVLLASMGVRGVEFVAPPTELPAEACAPRAASSDASVNATLFTRPSGRSGRHGRRTPNREAPFIPRDTLVRMLGGEEQYAWVLPRYRTDSTLVEAAGLLAGIPVVASVSNDVASLPELRFAARHISASPLLHAVVADELALVVVHPDRPPDVVHVVTHPVLVPWTAAGPVDDSEHWTPGSMAAAQRAGALLRDGGITPARLLLGSTAHLGDQTEVPAVVLSTLLLGVDGPLPLAEFVRRPPHEDHARAQVDGVDVMVIDTPAFQRALRAAVLLETEGETFSPVQRMAERMASAADDVEATIGAALREAKDLGAPTDILRAIAAPAVGLIAALRATTRDRLLRRMGSGEILLATLLSDPPPSLAGVAALDAPPAAEVDAAPREVDGAISSHTDDDA